MSPAPIEQPEQFKSISLLTRIRHRDSPLAELLAAAKEADQFPITFVEDLSTPVDDYAQVDSALTIAPELDQPPADPPTGLSYSGFSPEQRRFFIDWLAQPTQPAAQAYQQLHLAHIETCLFEQTSLATDAQTILRYLHETDAWSKSGVLSRLMLLSFWLRQDGDELMAWLENGRAHASVIGIALGQAALLGQILTPRLLAVVMQCWQITKRRLDNEMAHAQLASLSDTLGAEPLAFALAELGDEAQQPKPWRAAHRDLRIALPQPNLRPLLEPLLNEAKNISEQTSAQPAATEAAPDSQNDGKKDGKWSLVLEFQQSRSEYFDFALHRARQHSGFVQIMDENRKIVYRISYQKNEMRHFWLLWEYVQNWSGTEVYMHGEALEKWKIWPYSQYLR